MDDSLQPRYQRTVWQTIKSLNAAWTGGNSVDLRNYFHPDIVTITRSDKCRIESRDAWAASRTAFTQAAKFPNFRRL